VIPRSALILGLAGLMPFALCALAAATGWPGGLASRADGIAVQYGLTILAFMSGVLWGFATRAAGRQAALLYGASVMPALWAFFTTLGPTDRALPALMLGFGALLALDWTFARAGLAPVWWMRLRAGLTTWVLTFLAVTAYA
jgi:hypothetical protein